MTSDLLTRSQEQLLLDTTHNQLFIGGEWVSASTGAVFAVEDPATGRVLRTVSDASSEDALSALDRAAQASAGWRATPPGRRSEILRCAYELMLTRTDELALLVTLEMGKPLAESVAEVRYAAGFLRWYSEEAVRISGRYTHAEDGASRILTMKQPVGPCLFVTPWNFPLAMGARKIGPALAAGCTCVVKPAKQTPLSMLALADIFTEAGLPGSVLNVICGSSAAALVGPLLRDPRLRKLSFTGSTEVGQILSGQASEQVLRVSMELGGNAAFIVFADADLDAAVEGALAAKMRNGGEACTSANRFYVHESIAGSFAARLSARMMNLRLGRGTEPGTQVGPIIDAIQRGRIQQLVDDAVTEGARVLSGGTPPDGPGYFYPPTVLDSVDPTSRLVTEEIFGPVAPVMSFIDDADAITVANDTVFGLAAYVYTRDLSRAFAVAEQLDTGMVALNQGSLSNVGAPFGGIKHSGFGREGGPEGIEEYLDLKYIALATPVDASRRLTAGSP